MEATEVLNIGGGSKDIPLPHVFDGMTHVLLDIEPGPDVDLALDARYLRLSPELEGRFAAVYISHNLEHYYNHEIPVVLDGVMFVLQPGGTIDVRVPNIGLVGKAIAGGADLDDVAYESPAGSITWLDMVYGYGRAIEEMKQDHWGHKTGFTIGRLRRILRGAGFEGIVAYGHDPGFELQARAYKPMDEERDNDE